MGIQDRGFHAAVLPNDVCAAIGLARSRSSTAAGLSTDDLGTPAGRTAPLSWLVRPQDPGPREQHSYFTYFVRVLGGQRNRLAKYLYDKGIYTTLRYHPLHLNAIYQSPARLPELRAAQ